MRARASASETTSSTATFRRYGGNRDRQRACGTARRSSVATSQIVKIKSDASRHHDARELNDFLLKRCGLPRAPRRRPFGHRDKVAPVTIAPRTIEALKQERLSEPGERNKTCALRPERQSMLSPRCRQQGDPKCFARETCNRRILLKSSSPSAWRDTDDRSRSWAPRRRKLTSRHSVCVRPPSQAPKSEP